MICEMTCWISFKPSLPGCALKSLRMEANLSNVSLCSSFEFAFILSCLLSEKMIICLVIYCYFLATHPPTTHACLPSSVRLFWIDLNYCDRRSSLLLKCILFFAPFLRYEKNAETMPIAEASTGRMEKKVIKWRCQFSYEILLSGKFFVIIVDGGILAIARWCNYSFVEWRWNGKWSLSKWLRNFLLL